MTDLSQTAFDNAEAIADALHSCDGLDAALLELLDEPLARLPDRGQSVHAILDAARLFRLQAARAARELALASAGDDA